MDDIKLYPGVKTFIKHEGKILIIEESDKYHEGTSPGQYDVVGGRVKPGERFDKCLIREVKEETGLNIKIGQPFYVDEWRPTINGQKTQIVCTYFESFALVDNVKLSPDFKTFKWIDPKEHQQYKLMYDIHPVFEAYLKR